MDVKKFYTVGIGDELINENNYSENIKNFLENELKFFEKKTAGYEAIIEVGCMHGRHLSWAIINNKYYVGIDIVDRYIVEARENAQKMGIPKDNYLFLNKDARNLHEIQLNNDGQPSARSNYIIIFPFNCFGNIEKFEEVLISLKECGMKFIITTYTLDEKTNSERYDYYKNSNNSEIKMIEDNTGVRFTSKEGLNSIAYSREYLTSKCKQIGIDLFCENFGESGIAYFN